MRRIGQTAGPAGDRQAPEEHPKRGRTRARSFVRWIGLFWCSFGSVTLAHSLLYGLAAPHDTTSGGTERGTGWPEATTRQATDRARERDGVSPSVRLTLPEGRQVVQRVPRCLPRVSDTALVGRSHLPVTHRTERQRRGSTRCA